MFFLDKLYKDDKNYPRDNNEIEKFLYYREQENDGIDADVCVDNIKIYRDCNPYIKQLLEKKYPNSEIKLQPRCDKKYELVLDEPLVIRGDTLVNCMQTLLLIINNEDDTERIISDEFEEIKNRLNDSETLKGDSEIKEYLESFVKECYSEGNFFAIPYVRCDKGENSLNRAKGYLKKTAYNYTMADNSDTFFKVCECFFKNSEATCRLTKLINERYEIWEPYKGNWKKFIEDNCFQDFVDKDYSPIELWKTTESGFKEDLKYYLKRAVKALESRRKRLTGQS